MEPGKMLLKEGKTMSNEVTCLADLQDLSKEELAKIWGGVRRVSDAFAQAPPTGGEAAATALPWMIGD